MKNVFLILSVLIILVLVAFAFLKVKERGVPLPSQGEEEVVIEPLPKQPPDVLYNVSGVVQSVSEESLVMEAHVPHIDEGGNVEVLFEEKTVLFTLDTDVRKLTFVTDATGSSRPQERKAQVSDIVLGGMIEVVSDVDVREQGPILAIRIRIFPK